MALSKKLRAFINEAKKEDSYWVEKAKLGFSIALERWRRQSQFSNSELAEKIGTSPAYITKVFRGDANFTIETMNKLARACGGQLDIQIVDCNAKTSHWGPHIFQAREADFKVPAFGVSASSGVTETENDANPWFPAMSAAMIKATNDERFALAA